MLRNRGFLSLVSPSYYEFGRLLVRKVNKGFDEESLVKEGGESVKRAMEKLFADEDLISAFLACDPTTVVSIATRVKILQALIRCTFNARKGVDIRHYQETKTGRYARKGTQTTFRGGLRESSKEKVVSKAERLVKYQEAAQKSK